MNNIGTPWDESEIDKIGMESNNSPDGIQVTARDCSLNIVEP